VLLAAGAPTGVARRPLVAVAVALVSLAVVSSLLSPWLADRRVRAAEDALAADHVAEAADRADDARALDPVSVEPLFTKAIAKERQGQVIEALALYVRATQLQPENPETWYQLGVFEKGLRSYDWAELHLTRARELDPYGPARRDLQELRVERAKRG
jgi:Flp pilus assembly protein TadD